MFYRRLFVQQERNSTARLVSYVKDQTFTPGLPVIGVASLIFPHFRQQSRDVQPLHLLNIFPPGQGKLPPLPGVSWGVPN